MTFIQKSPARQLREQFPLERSSSRRPRAGDWQKIGDGTPVRCGLLVSDIDDERGFVGRIRSYDGAFATIVWVEGCFAGYVSHVRYANLRQANNV